MRIVIGMRDWPAHLVQSLLLDGPDLVHVVHVHHHLAQRLVCVQPPEHICALLEPDPAVAISPAYVT